ncbi:hypothetical protein EV359DRAFT_88125 [Lentinula novae-zelandiae]|nr:hypothetical protein EV359DRAFT_88125 [Lentinula novae-zelandiae]
MTSSRTTTTTVPTQASTSSRPADPPSPGAPLDDKEEIIMREAMARVERVKAQKAEEAARKRAEEEAARKAVEEAREKAAAAELEESRKRMAEAATARSRRGSLPGGASKSSRRPVVEIQREKGKGKAKAQAVGGDPDDGDDDEEDEDERAPCERCRSKKISCQMQAGKRSSIICKPCHDAKVKCSYSGRPSTVKREGGGQPTGERLVVMESQMAQLLADNRQFREAQVKADTYHCHFNRKLDWLMMDTARRRKSPLEMPKAGPSRLPKKRRRVVDSEEEEEQEEVEERVEEGEEDGEGEEEEEGDEPAPKKARSDKGKERAE